MKTGGPVYLARDDGHRYLENDRIWEGYLTHWLGRQVCARRLPQRDYASEAPIVIVWPQEPLAVVPFVELYYNERLVKYWASTFGHNAINVDGEIFNFSHLLNENEIMTWEEYFYRPPLGEFAPSPNSGKFEVLADGRVYYDKFGRNFMRTIHVLRIEGLDTQRMGAIFHRHLERIRAAPVNPRKPEHYSGFNFFTSSCTTIIRDGLRSYGFKAVAGLFPRDLFVSAATAVLHTKEAQNLTVQLYKMPQLKVPEGPYSQVTPLLNPRNHFRNRRLPAFN